MPNRIRYSSDELAFIEARKSMPRRLLHDKFIKKFGRVDVSVDALKALCLRKGWRTGRTGCFEKGSVPANKGKKMPYNPKSARTQFKKGHRPASTKYLGHERVSRDGYVEISVQERNPHTGFERRYVLKHRWEWEKVNGPVPDGMALKCIDGNKSNTVPSNWKLIPRAMLPRLNGIYGRGYDHAPAEVKPTIMAVTELEYILSERKKGQAESMALPDEKGELAEPQHLEEAILELHSHENVWNVRRNKLPCRSRARLARKARPTNKRLGRHNHRQMRVTL